jgi:hypothetical protein
MDVPWAAQSVRKRATRLAARWGWRRVQGRAVWWADERADETAVRLVSMDATTAAWTVEKWVVFLVASKADEMVDATAAEMGSSRWDERKAFPAVVERDCRPRAGRKERRWAERLVDAAAASTAAWMARDGAADSAASMECSWAERWGLEEVVWKAVRKGLRRVAHLELDEVAGKAIAAAVEKADDLGSEMVAWWAASSAGK